MATIGIAFTPEPLPPAVAQPGLPVGVDATATSARDPSQGDVVTLSGRTAETEQSQIGNNKAQFGEAAAFFFAETQSFRAANGSSGSQTVQTASVPELPVKLTIAGPVRQDATATNSDSAQQLAPSAPEQHLAATANFQRNKPINVNTGPTTATADTPLAELAQLDRTLQQIGIDPQSISLFNRMAMLLYANDPAALKMLVQTLQSGAQQMLGDPGAGMANVSEAQSQAGSAVQNLFSSETELPDSGTHQAGNGSETGSTDFTVEVQATRSRDTLLDPGAAFPRSAGPNRPAKAGSPRTPPNMSSLSQKLSSLNRTFAAVGAPQLAATSQNAQSSQRLDVTF